MKRTSIILLSILCIALLFVTACSNENNDESNSNYDIVDNIDADSIKIYKSGDQIELYLNSATNKQLADYIDSGASQVSVADKSIVEIQNGVLLPKSQGITYISCRYGDTIKNYNVIVHSGAEYVTSCSISGSSSNIFSAHVGQTYQISTANTSSCGVSELKIDTYTNYGSVEADELISVNSNGEIRVVGVGDCEIWVHSATNASDKGVRISISSSFAENILASAVTNWVTENLESTENGVITKSELAEIKTLTFTELLEFNESEWSTILPSLTLVTFDLSNGSSYNSTYNISSGKLSYGFVGNENSEYKFSILSDEREQLNLSFINFKLNSQSATGIDLSAVKKAVISYEGVCNIKGADAQNNGNGCNGITANNLTMTLHQDAVVSIVGGNGTSQSASGTRMGGIGVRTFGNFDVNALSSSYTTTLNIYGGNGGDGYSAGNSGGAGNSGISTDSLSIAGTLSCYIFGGNGGDGKIGADGADGSNGAKGNNESQGKDSVYGYDGRPGEDGKTGQDGGDGGNGGNAIIVTKMPTIQHSVLLSMTSGNGGNGANGGNGGDGGRGGNGGDDDNWSFIWIGDMSGGNGGAGGKGGAGGSKGDGGSSPSPVVIDGVNATLDLANTSETRGQSGSDGLNGSKGIDGAKGSHGYAGAGG